MKFDQQSFFSNSLTDVSSLSAAPICSCSTCTCSIRSSEHCLTYVLVILYESTLWCVRMIYDLFFQSLWEFIQYVREEIQSPSRSIEPCSMFPKHTFLSSHNVNRVSSKSSVKETTIVQRTSQPIAVQTEPPRKASKSKKTFSIPLALATSLHSTTSLYNDDFIRHHYIYPSLYRK